MATACFAQTTARQTLRGHIPQALRLVSSVGRLAASKKLDLTLGLPLRHADDLNRFLAEIYNPASAHYHQYLTPEQFAEQFGPSQTDYDSLIAFARANGLVVKAAHKNRTLLSVSGTVADIERAFHVTMRLYPHPTEARTVYAPDVEPSVDLDIPMLSISGLDNYVIPHPMDLRLKAFDATANSTAFVTGSGPRGNFIGNDFRTAYLPGVLLNGAGQSVGLFELDGYYRSDITSYESLAGLTNVTLTNVLLDGFSGSPGGNNVEVALDIDMAISMAPGLASVIVYEGTSPNDILNRMATDNLARQLSSSWSFTINSNTEQIFLQFAAQGQTLFEASGDAGAYAGAIPTPCADANLTVVGGTSLTTATPGGSWLAETAWSGSGGGISASNVIPTWQQAVNMSMNQGSTTLRNIPDVACLADSVIWLIANNGQEGATGGTSAAAPLWAGFTALVNQQAAKNGQPSVGFLNPAIYAIGEGASNNSCFHDIQSGNNQNSGSPNKFSAVAGYDLCTGWGTPNGSNLIYALLAPPDVLQIAPATNFIASGKSGGPFTAAAFNYLLTNAGSASLNWSLFTTSSLLNLSATNGTLAPGGGFTNVTATLTAAASNLLAGSYSATLLFTNLNDGFGQTRQFTLDVVTPPLITSQPTNQSVPIGSTVQFTVGTAANSLQFFQWQWNGTNLADGGIIFGSASPNLTLSNVTSTNAGAYSVLVLNAAGAAASASASLTLTSSAPLITAQPLSQTVLPGATVNFQVAAIGNLPRTYQWKFNSTNLVDGGTISGSTSNSLTLLNVSAACAGTYGVTVSNSLGQVASSGAVMTVTPVTAAGTTLTALYSFSGGNDGGNPNALNQATNGNFYGTTQNGGTNSAGTVFQISTNGNLNGLYSFTGGNDGASPFAMLAQGRDGNFYGTTFQGGTNDNGTVFVINTNGNLTTLLSFYGANGDLPFAGLTLGADGNFYGASYQGGASGPGSVYKISTNGVLTTLVSFSGANGSFPYAGLILGNDGNFYGTTFGGGANGDGSVYRLSTTGAFTTLFSFDFYHGANPYAALTQGSDGNFYGVAANGGSYSNGVLFEITSAGNFTNLYSFTGGNDGSRPLGGLLAAKDGNLYGTTAYGGAYGLGTIFRVPPNGLPITMVQFDGYNGANPETILTQGADGNIYGATEYGGAQNRGAIFRLNSVIAPQIVSQPASETVYLGTTAAFNVAVIGSSPLFFHWQKNGTNLTDGANVFGSATASLVISNVTAANASIYSVAISNAMGAVTSSNVLLEVLVSSPQILAQPTNQTLAPGNTAIFTVNAVGDAPLFYQWQFNGTNLTDGGNASGSATSTLTLANVVEPENGNYSVIVSNALNAVTSAAANLKVVPPSLTGTTLTTLYSFTGGVDGGSPNQLVLGNDGNLYGTTELGGNNQLGTAFKISGNGVLTTLASFGGASGSLPVSALIQGSDGNLYGTSKAGGNYFSGNLFKLTTGGSLANFYSFTGGSDGNNPTSSLTQGSDGNFYGMMADGGSYGAGNVFKVMPNGVFSNIYSFTGGNDGAAPANPLMQAADGNFYGTTSGGAHGAGNIFKISPGGSLTNLYSFTGGMDGSSPVGALAQGTDGYLYGATKNSTIGNFTFYGSIFKISTNGAFTLLYELNNNNGYYPYAGLIQATDGNFYGTTYSGGANDDGTVFAITPGGAITTLVAFDGFDDGAHPEAALAQGIDGNFYGATSSGGAYGHGTIFRINPVSAPQIVTQPVAQTVLAGSNATFNVTVFGAFPLGYQWQQNGTNLADGHGIIGSGARILTLTNVSSTNAGNYSVTVSNAYGFTGSSNASLAITSSPPIITSQPAGESVLPGATASFSVSTAGNSPVFYQWRENGINLADGGNISGSATATLTLNNVTAANAGLYSVLVSNSLGSVISSNALLSVASLTPVGINLTTLYAFTGGADGGQPNALIQTSNGVFYGTTVYGGTNAAGAIFEMTPNGALSNLYSFSGGNDGAFPLASLLQGNDGNFYGTACLGGGYGSGTIFMLSSNYWFNPIYSFTGGKDGASPEAALIQGRDGNFYGTTAAGGGNGHGNIFRMLPGGLVTNLHAFSGASEGGSPANSLLQGADGNFYGVTSVGGTNGDGAFFKITTNGSTLLSMSFNVTNGADPQAALTRGADGNFYGTTAGGGANGDGTIFKITTNGLLTTLYSFSPVMNAVNADGAAPHAGLVLGSDGNFYGTTANGGTYGDGTIFQVTPAGTLSTLAGFDGYNGANPGAALLQGLDGDFYGTTSSGGINDAGVIFRLSVPLPVVFQKIVPAGNSIALSWSSAAGQVYQLQYKTNLASSNWINLGSALTATNSTSTAIDALSSGTKQRYYRVVLLP